jgi:hypothetical protein
MSWIRKSPFSHDEDVTTRMVSLLSEEADRCGSPLTDAEREILSSETASLTEDLRQKASKLIKQIFEREQATSTEEDPKSFGACLEWVEPDYPNIAALAEEVITSGGFGKVPPLHGRLWVKDRVQLIGCGLLVVLFMFLIVIVWSLVSNRK